MHITVCICTCQRPALLKQLLEALAKQDAEGLFSFSVVVADNDEAQSARNVVSDFAKSSSLPVIYCVEPRRNIALARNKALENARGEYIAFIDDDEFPEPGWLVNLFKACEARKVDGVLGPVKPHFEQEPPEWVRKGQFYDRPTHATGFVMDWPECRTGNVLFQRRILEGLSEPFSAEYRIGSEDVDFFRRMMEQGKVFIWCDEAVVSEVVPPNRWTRRFMLKRALMRGKTSLMYPTGRVKNVLKSLVAVPLYTLALPLLCLIGHHCFMKYLVKLCDHVGRLLAVLALNPIRERES